VYFLVKRTSSVDPGSIVTTGTAVNTEPGSFEGCKMCQDLTQSLIWMGTQNGR